ncbi:MAG: Ig-like domain-containing protein, partial [Candidatus Cybelea sp.]
MAIASCAAPGRNAARLAPVEALAVPSLPPWIASISPTGNADNLAQIRVIFAKPLIAVQALSGPGAGEALRHLSIAPQLRGHFTALTPRMIGFVADQALPVGTRVRITLTAGLHDLNGDRLDRDLAWTFETEPLKFTNLPQLQGSEDEATPAPSSLAPKLQVTANAAVDSASLSAHTSLTGGNDRVGVSATLEAQPTPYPGTGAEALFNPALDTWVYDLRPTRVLHRGTTYALRIDPGVAPLYGNRASSDAFNGAIRTYAALAILPTPRPSPNS